MLLRQQLRIVERKQPGGPHIPRWQKVPLAALAMREVLMMFTAQELRMTNGARCWPLGER